MGSQAETLVPLLKKPITFAPDARIYASPTAGNAVAWKEVALSMGSKAETNSFCEVLDDAVDERRWCANWATQVTPTHWKKKYWDRKWLNTHVRRKKKCEFWNGWNTADAEVHADAVRKKEDVRITQCQRMEHWRMKRRWAKYGKQGQFFRSQVQVQTY